MQIIQCVLLLTLIVTVNRSTPTRLVSFSRALAGAVGLPFSESEVLHSGTIGSVVDDRLFGCILSVVGWVVCCPLGVDSF